MSADLGTAAQRHSCSRPLAGWLDKLRLWQSPPQHSFHRYPLVWLLAAMIVGSGLGHTLVAGRLTSCLVPSCLVLIPVLLLVVVILDRWGWRQLAGLLALVVAGLFSLTYAYLFRPPAADALSPFAQRMSQPIAVRAVVDSVAVWRPNPNYREHDPASQPWQTQWDVTCESVRDQAAWHAIAARSTLTVDGRIQDLLPGDVVKVFGRFHGIAPPTNPGAFDFAEHARQQSEFVKLSADGREQLVLIESRGTHPLRRLRGRVVTAVDRYLQRWVAFDQAPLAAALVFGQRGQVDWENQQELMATGTLHLLAISGMHVGIIAAVIVFACTLLSARSSIEFVLIASVCGLYAALAGGQPPVLRAVVLVGLFALARVWGRKTRLANFLSLAAIVLLLIQAANLTNVGVHLSFLAVGSIGVFALDRDFGGQRKSALQSALEESYSGWYRRCLLLLRSSWAALRLSFWVWLMTCPLVWMNFHVVAFIAIPLNVLIAFPLVISLLSGLVTGLCGWLPPLAWLSGKIAGGGLAAISWLVSVGQRIPGGHLWLPAPPGWWIACFYLTTLVWLIVFGKRRRGTLAAILTLWIMCGVALFSFGPRGYVTASWRRAATVAELDRELRCTFLDVGHGTSVMVELPSREVWLYDAGHLGATQRSHQEIAAALWELPTARIDRLIISHADADHYNATIGLLARFNVGSIVSTRRFWNSTSPEVARVHAVIEERSIAREEWNSASSGMLGGVRWQVLHPLDSLRYESDNASSLCVLLEYAGKRILLPGDLEGSGLLELVALPPRPCHALMAPHHGSLTHDPSGLLEWCRPNVIVISGNHRALRPQVLAQYALPDACLGLTFRDGAIQVRVSPRGELTQWHWSDGGWAPLSP